MRNPHGRHGTRLLRAYQAIFCGFLIVAVGAAVLGVVAYVYHDPYAAFEHEPGPLPEGIARPPGPSVGEPAPHFTLRRLAAESPVSLRESFQQRPTVLIFGSYS
jgi:hypothetical protein